MAQPSPSVSQVEERYIWLEIDWSSDLKGLKKGVYFDTKEERILSEVEVWDLIQEGKL